MKIFMNLSLVLFVSLALSCGDYCRCARGEYRGSKTGQLWILQQELRTDGDVFRNYSTRRGMLQSDGTFWVGDTNCSWVYNSHQCLNPLYAPGIRLVAWIDVDGDDETECGVSRTVLTSRCGPDANDPQGIGPAPGRENDAPWVITIRDPSP